MDVIPAVDVLDGRVVRLQEGDFSKVAVYDDDPARRAAGFVAEGASMVHVVDLAAARDGAPSEGLWTQIAKAGVPFQVGGGIRSVDRALEAIDAGATRVVLGTAAVWKPDVLDAVVGAVGAERVVVALDVRDGRATGAGWLDEGRDLTSVVTSIVAAGAERCLVTGIGRDGTMRGPDIEVIHRVQAAGPELAVIGSGGVGELEDLVGLMATGVEAVIVGRALYEERFTLAEALAIVRP